MGHLFPGIQQYCVWTVYVHTEYERCVSGKWVQTRFQDRYIKPFLVAAVIMGVAAFAVDKLLSALIPGRFVAHGLSILIAMLVYAVAVVRVGTLSESDMLALPMGGRMLRICKQLKIFPKTRFG